MSSEKTTEVEIRRQIAQARRVVVKVGSSSLASAATGLDLARLASLVAVLAKRQLAGSEVILVTSGAIAAGLEPLGFTRRPHDLAQQQAAAAVGQGLLMTAYTQAFAEHGIRTAQILLTKEDLANKESYSNALRTFGALTRLAVLPVVNENDTVATQEIRFGDNDHLAALVAELVRANALVLLSDVDGLYTEHPGNPGAKRVSFVPAVSELTAEVHRPGSSGVGRGGMATKIGAAELAGAAGIPVGLARWDQAAAILAGEDVGTVFGAATKRWSRRHGWLAHAASAAGQLHIDHGAETALTTTAASLLAAGIAWVDGDFKAGDSVEVVSPAGVVIGRGVVAFDSAVLPTMLGRTHQSKPVIHRDDLVMAPTQGG
ncbi:MAG: glutamate 5-kinase [Propionibacteriaceae bacterium]|jgi:glutamate 5-kinase|nr:glutamate 5-kinase [Propionibacteriaceae bacterium]